MNDRQHVTIIAEAGVNHNGQMELAKKLIDAAADAGADFVKFQAFQTDRLVSSEARKAAYQIQNMDDSDDRQYDMLKKLEIDKAFHRELKEYCKDQKIGFLSSAFDDQGIEMLHHLGLRIFKVPSGEITNLPYLESLGSLRCEVILSSGMATLEEIKEALNILIRSGTSKNQITVLHCNTDYPTKFFDVNLNAMRTIREALDVDVGYSDHTTGIEIPIAAAAMGATVIEKHFTMDRSMKGPDHKASLEPDELNSMVRSVRNIEKALGSGVKKPSDSEKKNRDIVRKSIHLSRNVASNSVLKKEDLIMLRPGDGLSPMKLTEVLNKETNKELKKGHKLSLSDLVM